jgi:signal transduction histidine kinase/ActR/RegA family two-component response regulator
VIFGDLLTSLLDLMNSEYGFIGEIHYDDEGVVFLQTHAITNIAWDAATQKFYEENAESGLKFYNLNSLFGKVITTKKTVISNDPTNDPRACGIPEGHPPLNYFLGIPFFEQGGNVMNGMVGIANKPGGYTEDDLKFIEPFTVTCSNLIQAYAVARENRRLIATLEETVQLRTHALEVANEELAEVNRKLSAASQAQMKHFACMSHEIRTPLNCVIGLSSLLAEDDTVAPSHVDSLKLIVASGNLLLTVVNDVLDFAKLQEGKVSIYMEESPLQEILDTVVKSIEVRGRERDIQLETYYGLTVPPMLYTDSRRLLQILYNLLGNAVKFSVPGKVIELTVHVVPQLEEQPQGDRRRLHSSNIHSRSQAVDVNNPSSQKRRSSEIGNDDLVHVVCNGGDRVDEAPTVLRFQVTDYGIGIKRENFVKIFHPFLQATDSTEYVHGGTGLGLAIASSLVKALGGRISVDSEVGEWTTFTVDLPLPSGPLSLESMRKPFLDSKVLLVGADPPNSRTESDLQSLGVEYAKLDTFESLIDFSKSPQLWERFRQLVLITPEDLFQKEIYDTLVEVRPTRLITYGPKYLISQSDFHLRSLTQLLPSAFMDAVGGTNSAHASTSSSGHVSTCDETNAGPGAHGHVLPGAPVAATDEPPYKDLRILVAEDNMINQKVLHRMLKKLGLSYFKFVENGRMAVDAAKTESFDLVLMDMQMPVMGGIEACRHIVEHRNSAGSALPRVVFVTANVSTEDEVATKAVGGEGFLSKPFSVHDLHQHMLQCIAVRS